MAGRREFRGVRPWGKVEIWGEVRFGEIGEIWREVSVPGKQV